MAAPKAYAEVREGKVTNLVMMVPAVAEAKTADPSYPDYIDIATTTGDATIGYDYADGAFTLSPEIAERQWASVREERNRLLAESDWVIIKAKETSTNIPAAWKTYRQALRDLTTTYSTPEEVVFPDKP